VPVPNTITTTSSSNFDPKDLWLKVGDTTLTLNTLSDGMTLLESDTPLKILSFSDSAQDKPFVIGSKEKKSPVFRIWDIICWATITTGAVAAAYFIYQ